MSKLQAKLHEYMKNKSIFIFIVLFSFVHFVPAVVAVQVNGTNVPLPEPAENFLEALKHVDIKEVGENIPDYDTGQSIMREKFVSSGLNDVWEELREWFLDSLAPKLSWLFWVAKNFIARVIRLIGELFVGDLGELM